MLLSKSSIGDYIDYGTYLQAYLDNLRSWASNNDMVGGSLHEALTFARFSDGTRAEVPLSIVNAIVPEAVDVTGVVDGPGLEICLLPEREIGRTLEKAFDLPSGVDKNHRIHH